MKIENLETIDLVLRTDFKISRFIYYQPRINCDLYYNVIRFNNYKLSGIAFLGIIYHDAANFLQKKKVK